MKNLLLAFAVTIAAADVQAQRAGKPLPDFVVYDNNAEPTESATFAAGRRAVLVYVKPDCRSCDQLLGLLTRAGRSGLASRLVLVVMGTPEDAGSLVARLPEELDGLTWFADRDGQAWNALELTGLPLMMGIEGQRIEWTLAGAPDRRLVDSAVRGWLDLPGGQR